MTGAQAIIEVLIEQGVDTVFGYPGGQVIPLYDALYEKKGKIRHILTAHEQGASHAADGYARSTGKVGVCFATSGPGATNLVTGLATAYMDSSPVIAITGNVPLSLLGKDSFQEVDITGVTMPVTKHNYIVKKAEDLVPTIREAFHIARSGRPGPVLIDVPKNIQTDEMDYEYMEPQPVEREVSRLREEDIQKAISMIHDSQKPMCYIGGGVIRSDASPELSEFLDKCDAAVCSSLMGLGAVRADSPRFTGLVGMHGTKLSNMSINACDLLIVIGARFSDRVISKGSTFARQARILQIDIDPAEFNKNVRVDLTVPGDCRKTLSAVTELLPQGDHHAWRESFAEAADEERRAIIDPQTRPAGGPLRMAEVVLEMSGAGSAIRQSLDMVSYAGKIVLTGWPKSETSLPTNLITTKEIDVIGGRNSAKEFEEALELIESGKVNARAVLSKVITMDEVPEAVRELSDYPGRYLKINALVD